MAEQRFFQDNDTGHRLDLNVDALSANRILTIPNSDVALRKDNVSATAAPAVTDDSASNYTIGSLWVDVTNDNVYQAVDVSVGAAVWKQVNNTASGAAGNFVTTTVAGSSHTLALTNDRQYLRFTNGTTNTITIPTQASVSWVDDTEVVVEQASTGAVVINGAVGVTILPSSGVATNGVNRATTLKRVASNTWVVGRAPAPTVAVGTVTSLAPGATPTVANSGSTYEATLDFGLPTTPTVAVGTVTTLASGASPTVVNGGTASAISLNFGLPASPTVAAGTVTMLTAGSSPTVTNAGTAYAANFNFGIPTPAALSGYTVSNHATDKVFDASTVATAELANVVGTLITDLQAGASGAAGSLTPVAITDAAVTMAVNTKYYGSIAGFTADRNYTVPAGTAGDAIEIQLTTGDDTFELIIIGAAGVSINGGTAASEWSRLFADNEFVRLKCIATNDWRVEVDGRVNEYCELFGIAATAYTTAAHTVFTLGGNSDPYNMRGTNEIRPRRNGRYVIHASNAFQPTGGSDRYLSIAYQTSGAAFAQANFIQYGILYATGASATINNYIEHTATIGNSYSAGYFISAGIGGTNAYHTLVGARPTLMIRRV